MLHDASVGPGASIGGLSGGRDRLHQGCPLRIDFPDALYHVTARGDRREDIFEGDEDTRVFLVTFSQIVTHFNWLCDAWCLMDNHYHLLTQTPDGNLSQGMRQLNGVYTQASRRRHQRVVRGG
ncbi:transposase [Curvibacter fontanus]